MPGASGIPPLRGVYRLLSARFPEEPLDAVRVASYKFSGRPLMYDTRDSDHVKGLSLDSTSPKL